MVCNSGGATGADLLFEIEGGKYGVKILAFSFFGHNTSSDNKVILTNEELNEGWEHIKIANKTLKRNIYNLSPYVKKLLSRNWFQVKNSEAIFGIGTLQTESLANGGTSWAIQMGVDNNKEVYFFEQNKNKWYKFSYISYKFKEIDYIPELTDTFAGIGTRDINDNGTNAIKQLYTNKFKKL